MIEIQTLRFPVDRSVRNPITNPADNKQPFHFWRGKELAVQVGNFFAGELQSISNLASITLEIDVSQVSPLPPVMKKEVLAAALDDTLDASTWDDGSKQHALFEFSASEANIDLGGQPSRSFWLTVTGLRTDGKTVILGYGSAVCDESNAGTAGTPPANDPAYYTKEESHALFLRAAPAGALYRFGAQYLELYNADTDTWVAITVVGEFNQIERNEVPNA